MYSLSNLMKLKYWNQFYNVLTEDTELEKNWQFLKMHLHVHLLNDIRNKGCLAGQSTHDFEKRHGNLRKIYLRQTNFKDIADQICILPNVWLFPYSISRYSVTSMHSGFIAD